MTRRAKRNLTVEWRDFVRTRERCDLTFAELGSRYLVHLEERGNRRSLREFHSQLRPKRSQWDRGGALTSAFGEMDCRAIEPDHVRAWIEAQLAAGYAASTVRTRYSLLAIVFDFGVEIGAADQNAARQIPRGTLPKKASRDPGKNAREVMADEEVRALLELEDTDPECRWLWWALAFTGCRIGEAAGLRWGDVHDARPLAEVRVERSWDNHQRRFSSTKTGTTRSVPLHPEWGRFLERQRAEQAELLGRDVGGEDLLCPAGLIERSRLSRYTETGPRPWHRGTALFHFRRDLERAGVPMTQTGERRLHTMRHSFVTGMLAGGADERVSRTFTHAADAQDVFGRYAHVRWARACEEIRKLSYGRP